MSSLRVATCQFPVSGDVARNGSYMRRITRAAARAGADLVHFPETALSGYAGVNLIDLENYAWDHLDAEWEKLSALVKDLGVWLVAGSAHRLSEPNLAPRNSLFVIGPGGDIVGRYDKIFCTATDLIHYSPGDHLSVIDVNGVRCGLLICHDLRYPELYREYCKLDIQLLLQSFHNADFTGPTIHTAIVRPTLQGHAASNFMWISASNASGHYQAWPSVFISRDGRVCNQLRRHRSGWMVNLVDTEEALIDKSPYRQRAMNGRLHNEVQLFDGSKSPSVVKARR